MLVQTCERFKLSTGISVCYARCLHSKQLKRRHGRNFSHARRVLSYGLEQVLSKTKQRTIVPWPVL